MNIIQIVLATLVTLGILVTIHEYGHFWVARRCGVKVLRFSVGFGRALYSWRDRHGTEFVLAAIPLGGYVKMLDEREGDVAPEDAKYAFNRQSVGKRIAVVVAGPLANFLFAIVAYWLLFVVGVNTVVPVIGDVKPDSMAARAGLQKGQEITAVGDVRTTTWQAINIQLLGYIGDSGELLLTTRALNGEIEQRSTLLLDNWLRGVEQPDPLEDMGVKPYVPPIPPIVGQVLEQSAGERAGLKAQDKITTLDGDAIDEWQTFVAKIKAHPQQPVLLGVERDNQSLLITVTPDAKQLETGEVVGYLGVGAKAFEWPAEMRRDIKYSVFSAWAPALGRTWEMSALTLASLKKMLVGMISIKNLSGPITIAKVAGASAQYGLSAYLGFLALLSVSLGVLNLLPIPVLDGGHLAYYIIEAVKGSPVSEKIQLAGFKVGLFLVIGLMVLALYNDLMRL